MPAPNNNVNRTTSRTKSDSWIISLTEKIYLLMRHLFSLLQK